MKRKSIAVSIFIILLFCISSITSIALTDEQIKEQNYTFLRDNNQVNKIEDDKQIIEVNGKYNFNLQLISKSTNSDGTGRALSGTQYKAVGNYGTVDPFSKESQLSSVYKFTKQKKGVEQYVYVRQAGFYMGQSIDVKISIDTSEISDTSVFRVFAPHYDERTNTAYYINSFNPETKKVELSDSLSNAFLTLGSTSPKPVTDKEYRHFTDKYNNNSYVFAFINDAKGNPDKISYSYEFFETQDLDANNNIVEGTTPISLTGLWNVDNANTVKVLTDLNGFNDLTKYYVYDSSTGTINNELKTDSNNILFTKDSLGNFMFSGHENAYQPKLEDQTHLYGKVSTSFTTLFENKTKLSYSVSPRLVSTQIIGDGYSKQYSTMSIKYSRSAIPRVAPTEPYVIGIKNTATHTDTENYTDLQYDIRFGVGSNDEGKRNDALSIQTEVPDYYDIKANKIEIVNMVNNNVLTLGTDYTVEIDPTNSSKAKIIFTNPTKNNVNDGYFRVSVSAKTNDKFEFAPDKYGYLNDSSSEDNGYMHFDLAENTTLTYTHNASNNIDKTLTSKKIDERSIAKVNYEGVPLGEAKDGLTLLQGNSISAEYPDAASLLQDGFDKLVDTNNIARDTPVKATFIGELPETKNLAAGTVVDVPILLTSKLGVTKKVVAKITIRSNKSLLNVEFRNEVGDLLSSVQKDFPVNTEVDLTKIPEVVNELDKYIANGEYTVERPVPEKFTLSNGTATKVYKLIGQVIIASAPEIFDFGTQKAKIDPIRQKQAVNLASQDPLAIKDNRLDQSKGWTLYLRTSKEFTSEEDGSVLPGILQYRIDNNSNNDFTVSNASKEVYKKNTGGDYTVSNDWSDDGAGLGINIDVKDIKKLGTYSAEIEWILIPDLVRKPVDKPATPVP